MHFGIHFTAQPSFICQICKADLDNGGRVMIKEWKEKMYSIFARNHEMTITKQSRKVVCPDCQPKLEKEGYHLEYYWDKNGIVQKPIDLKEWL